MTTDADFNSLINIAYIRIDEHVRFKSVSSSNVAIFACGRVVGYAMANDDHAMNDKVSKLRQYADEKGIAV